MRPVPTSHRVDRTRAIHDPGHIASAINPSVATAASALVPKPNHWNGRTTIATRSTAADNAPVTVTPRTDRGRPAGNANASAAPRSNASAWAWDGEKNRGSESESAQRWRRSNTTESYKTTVVPNSKG